MKNSDNRATCRWWYYPAVVLAFAVSTLGVQATSHFYINKAHYQAIEIFRPEPIMELGLLAILLQGIILAYGFRALVRAGPPVLQGVKFSLAAGVFLASYIVLAEPAKTLVPDLGAYMRVEAGASFVQFALFGVLLGLVRAAAEKPA